eukprot:3692042-Pleurochrysis_carterae.AAC.1
MISFEAPATMLPVALALTPAASHVYACISSIIIRDSRGKRSIFSKALEVIPRTRVSGTSTASSPLLYS